MTGNQSKEARKQRVRPLVALILPAQPQPIIRKQVPKSPLITWRKEGTKGRPDLPEPVGL